MSAARVQAQHHVRLAVVLEIDHAHRRLASDPRHRLTLPTAEPGHNRPTVGNIPWAHDHDRLTPIVRIRAAEFERRRDRTQARSLDHGRGRRGVQQHSRERANDHPATAHERILSSTAREALTTAPAEPSAHKQAPPGLERREKDRRRRRRPLRVDKRRIPDPTDERNAAPPRALGQSEPPPLGDVSTDPPRLGVAYALARSARPRCQPRIRRIPCLARSSARSRRALAARRRRPGRGSGLSRWLEAGTAGPVPVAGEIDGPRGSAELPGDPTASRRVPATAPIRPKRARDQGPG
jgi:hypothetical protein